MPQIQLSIFPASSTAITDEPDFEQRDGQVFCFNGHLSVFTAAAGALGAFRPFTSHCWRKGAPKEAAAKADIARRTAT